MNHILLSLLGLLPSSTRARIEGSPNLQKILTNTGWLFADRVLRLGVGLFVGVWVARYLGPEQFGLFSYVLALVALFGAFSSMGLNGIVVRDLIRQPDTASQTLGTAFVIQLITGFLSFLLLVLTISLVRPDNDMTRIMMIVLGSVLIFKSAEVIKYSFEANVESKFVVLVESCIFVIISIVKVFFIICKFHLMAFVWLALFESIFIAVGLFVLYLRKRGKAVWKVRLMRAKSLLRDSWPLTLSSLAIMVYMRIDQIMLGSILGDSSVGIYTAAVRVSEVWYFMPLAIVASVFPAITETKKNNEKQYLKRMQKLYDVMVLLSFGVAIPMTFFSERIVGLLFGQDFIQAGSILAIHIWAGIFVSLGVASGKWLILEELQKYTLYRTLSGAIINVILNALLIPKYGGNGAAVSTVLSYFVSVFSLYFPGNKVPIKMMLSSLLIHRSIRRVFCW